MHVKLVGSLRTGYPEFRLPSCEAIQKPDSDLLAQVNIRETEVIKIIRGEIAGIYRVACSLFLGWFS